MSSYASNYPLQARFAGWYRVEPESLLVVVTSGRVRNIIPGNWGDVATLRDVWVAAGIGELSEAGWAIDTLAARITVVPALVAGEERTTLSLRFTVPLRSNAGLAERWLFFQVGAVQAGLFGLEAGVSFSNYVCDTSNLLGSTVASRVRAAQMRRTYSEAC